MSKFSIIVPVYNVETYIEKCARSILNQDFKDFELILVDDGATDNSGKICDKILEENSSGTKIKVIHQDNKGLGGARNTGIDAAEGEYLFFIDSDDTIVDGALQELSDYIIQNDVDILTFDIVKVDENGNELYHIPGFTHGGVIATPKENKSLILTDHSACNKVIRKSLFTDNNIIFPERLWFEDVATIFKLFPFAKMGYIPRTYYVYLERTGSIMNSARCDKNIDMITAMNSTIDFYKKKEMFNEYYEELEFIAAYHLYYLSSIRIMKINKKHDLLKKFRDYMKVNFPSYNENKYLSKKEKLIIKLLDNRMYSAIKLIFEVKGKMNSLRK